MEEKVTAGSVESGLEEADKVTYAGSGIEGVAPMGEADPRIWRPAEGRPQGFKDPKPYTEIPGLGPEFALAMASIDRRLDPDSFRDSFIFLVKTFAGKDELPLIFQADKEHLSWMCKKTFGGMTFDEAYDWFFARGLSECRSGLRTLALHGNTTAINVLAKVFMKIDGDQIDQGLKVKIVANVPKEDNKK